MSLQVLQPAQNIIQYASPDLHKNEALDLTLQNLLNLEDITGQINTKFDQKLAQTREKMQLIQERLNKASQKIQALQNVKNMALTIQSPSLYIKPYKLDKEIYKEKESLFSGLRYQSNENLALNPLKTELSHTKGAQGEQPEIKFDEIKVQMTKVYGKLKQKQEKFDGENAIQNQKFEGLGTLPNDINYVESLLVFNSRHNPYTHYTSIDNLQKFTQKIQKNKIEQKLPENGLIEAPFSIKTGTQIEKFRRAAYNFVPELKVAPKIKISQSLGLEGALDNLNEDTQETEILPSQEQIAKQLATVPEPQFNQSYNQDELNFKSLYNNQQFNNNTQQQQAMSQSQPPSQQIQQQQQPKQQQQQQFQNQIPQQQQQQQQQQISQSNVLPPPQLPLKLPGQAQNQGPSNILPPPMLPPKLPGPNQQQQQQQQKPNMIAPPSLPPLKPQLQSQQQQIQPLKNIPMAPSLLPLKEKQQEDKQNIMKAPPLPLPNSNKNNNNENNNQNGDNDENPQQKQPLKKALTLMDEIKMSSVSKLKKASPIGQRQEEKKPVQPQMSLMDHLKQQIQLRYEGMQNKENQNKKKEKEKEPSQSSEEEEEESESESESDE